MRARLTKIGAAIAALAALAVGGSALASAAQKGSPPPPAATQVQQGDQATPDTSAEVPETAAEAQAGAVDTDNVQQGDQSGSDTAGAQSEPASSEAGPSDGPGGYADTSPNADTQQTGEH